MLVIAKRARIDAQIRDVSLAWFMASFERQKKLPDLKRVIAEIDPKPQTVSEMKQTLFAIAHNFGLKPRTRKKATR